ncbi:unnamed protein product, partial [Acanthocheilonema viteae]
GILGSGFALKVQQHQRQKHLIRRRVPAARLIQCMWRHYAATPESCSVATWRVYLATINSSNSRGGSGGGGGGGGGGGNGCQPSLISRIRQSTKRRTGANVMSHSESTLDRSGGETVELGKVNALSRGGSIVRTLTVPEQSDDISFISASDYSEVESLGALGFSLSGWKAKGRSSTNTGYKKSHDDSSGANRTITATTLLGTTDIEHLQSSGGESAEPNQSLSLCKYLTEEDGDYMMGDYNLIMAPLYHWWEKIQQRYRQSDERDGTEHTMWNHLGSCASLTKSRRLRESHVDIYNVIDDDSPSMQPKSMDEFTPSLKNVIRAIRRIQLLVARRKFKEALKPYDVKDVIEQYSAGHVDLQARVKHVQQRLDQIVGKPKDEVKVSLTHRVIVMEMQMQKIDKKLDLLLEIFLENKNQRKHLTDCPFLFQIPNSAPHRIITNSEPGTSSTPKFDNSTSEPNVTFPNDVEKFKMFHKSDEDDGQYQPHDSIYLKADISRNSDNSLNTASARTQFWTPLETPNSISQTSALLSHHTDNNELEPLLDNQKDEKSINTDIEFF